MIDSVRRIDQKRQPPQQRKKKPAMPTNAMASNRETIRKIIASKKPIWRFNLFHLKSLRNFHFHESLSLWKLNVLLFFVFFVSIASSISALSLSLKPLFLQLGIDSVWIRLFIYTEEEGRVGPFAWGLRVNFNISNVVQYKRKRKMVRKPPK